MSEANYTERKQRRTGLVSLTEGEASSDFESNIEDEVANHLDIVTGHNHLLGSIGGTLRESQGDGDISSSDEALGSVVGHERSVATTFFLGQDLRANSQYNASHSKRTERT